MDDAVVVEAVDGTEDRTDDNDSAVLCKLSLCKDMVKAYSAGEFKTKVVFCARLGSSRKI